MGDGTALLQIDTLQQANIDKLLKTFQQRDLSEVFKYGYGFFDRREQCGSIFEQRIDGY